MSIWWSSVTVHSCATGWCQKQTSIPLFLVSFRFMLFFTAQSFAVVGRLEQMYLVSSSHVVASSTSFCKLGVIFKSSVIASKRRAPGLVLCGTPAFTCYNHNVTGYFWFLHSVRKKTCGPVNDYRVDVQQLKFKAILWSILSKALDKSKNQARTVVSGLSHASYNL